MKLAVFLPNWVGDVVMATPAIRALRQGFPGASLTGVMRPYVADVLRGTDLLDDEVFYAPKGGDRSQRLWSVVRRLRAERFDAAVLFPNSLHSAGVAWLGGCRQRWGFARDGRGWLLTHPVPPRPRKDPYPVLLEYLRLVGTMGCPTSSTQMELAITKPDREAITQFWSKHPNVNPADGFVCLNTGGAFGSAKNWPIDRFTELAKEIRLRYRKTVLVLCGPAERESAREIARNAGLDRVLSLADETLSLGLTKVAIRDSQLLVTTDSGPRHFAAAFGIPTVALFGPTHQAWSDTFSPVATNLQASVPCGPCQQRVCPLAHHRCMDELSVESVMAAVEGVLGRRDVIPLKTRFA